MSETHKPHQIISDFKELRGYADDVGVDDIYRNEALRLSLLDREQRAAVLRDLDNRVTLYNENSTLRQIGQAHRLRTHLITAHERLKAAGR